MPEALDPLEAARRLGHDHGIARLARLMGMNERTLAHQLNPEQDGHRLGLGTAIAMTELTGDEAILDAWAALRGKTVVAMPPLTASEDELLDDVLALDDLQGEFARALKGARADGVIDPTEYRLLAQVLHRMAGQTAKLRGQIGSQVREKP